MKDIKRIMALGCVEKINIKYLTKNNIAVITTIDHKKLSKYIKEKEKEIERLNNIINEALGIANERFNYYSHYKSNNEEHLEDWENIFNVLLRRDN